MITDNSEEIISQGTNLDLTRAVEWLGELSGHDLDDESDTEPEHLAEQAGLSADAHGQVHHDLL